MKKITFCLFFIAVYITAHCQVITVVAGLGPNNPGYSGDGGAAVAAELAQPFGLAIDDSDNIYFSDQSNNVIRKIEHSSGKIYTVAGNYALGIGYSGDGGPATLAELNYPAGIALDASDNIYIADEDNNRVRMVEHSTGIISTIAGISGSGYSGNGGPATVAELFAPLAVAVDDSGNVFIAEFWNNVVRKIEHSTGIINNYAGNAFDHGTPNGGFSGDGGPATAAEIYNPTAVYMGDSGKLWVADASNDVVRYVNPSGVISTFAGIGTMGGFSGDGGPATAAELGFPTGITLDDSSNVVITDAGDQVIRKVEHHTGIITTICGHPRVAGYSGNGGPATAAELDGPEEIALDTSGEFIFADVQNDVIRKIGPCTILSQTSVTKPILCYGDSGEVLVTPLSGIAPYVYLWSDSLHQNDSVLTHVPAGAYYVFITDPDGCTGIDSITITQPAAIILQASIFTDTTKCKATAGVTVSGGTIPYTYSWSNTPGTTDTVFNLCNGTYCCTVTDNNHCVKSVCTTITGVGVENIAGNNGGTGIYPDPNNGVFVLSITNTETSSAQVYEELRTTNIEIYNVFGQKVYSQSNIQHSTFSIPNSTFNIDLSGQPGGMYFYRIVNDENDELGEGKFIIQK